VGADNFARSDNFLRGVDNFLVGVDDFLDRAKTIFGDFWPEQRQHLRIENFLEGTN
jgi:hypothetical protein